MKHAAIAFFSALLLVAVPVLGAKADDAADIQATISAQLDAFNAGNGAEAYSYAAPNIKSLFPSPQAFMGMVRSGYDPVYRSSGAVFGELSPHGSGYRQEVYLTDSKGQSWIASYTLERQADGLMKITGCRLRKGDDIAV